MYVAGVVPFSAAHKAGIKEGDVIEAIGDQPIESFDQMRDIVTASVRKPLAFRVKRENKELSLTVTPRENPTTPTLGMIGVAPGNIEREWIQYGFFAGWEAGFSRAAHTTVGVAVGTAKLFSRFKYREMKEGLAGPAGIVGLIYQRAREGWKSFLFITALLNIALMVFNILPIPILDGGHILITSIESATRRPVPPRLLVGIYYVFFALLITLMLTATVFDVQRFAEWFR
jgi:regulator of sigma E protease